jgi:hypothetical protein
MAGGGIVMVASNKAAVTWTGDLGSAVAEIIFKILNEGQSVAVSDSQNIVNKYAPAQDMLGNIDSYVMANEYNISDTAGKKVSELLRAYYLGEAKSPGGRAREHRYSLFCKLTGLGTWTGSGFSNEAAWLKFWTAEVAGTAALYVGAITGIKDLKSKWASKPMLLSIILDIKDPNKNPIAGLLLKNFLAALKKCVASEPP